MLDKISSITNIVVNIINISNGIINWPEPYSLGILLCYGLECLTYNRNISIIFVVLMIIAVKIFNIFERFAQISYRFHAMTSFDTRLL